MDPGRSLAFAGVAVLVIIFPGPSVLFIVSRSLALGRRAALITVAGNELGEFLQVAAVAAGIGALVAASSLAFTVIKLAGAAYLVYLGIRTIAGRRFALANPVRPTAGSSWRRVLRQAFVVGVTNPKTTVFFAAVLPQFVATRLGHVPLQMLALGAVWTVLALISDGAWALAASAVGRWLGGSTARRQRVRWGSGVAMVGLGVGLAVSGRPSTT